MLSRRRADGLIRSCNLYFAWGRLRRLPGAEDRLVAAGVPVAVVRGNAPPLVGIWPVEVEASDRWDEDGVRIPGDRWCSLVPGPDPAGRNAIVVPAAGVVSWPDGDVGCGLPVWRELDDLVAFYLGAPGEWWRVTGAATWLGEAHIERARAEGEPVRLVATPLDWLRAGGDAACLVDWRADPRHDLRGLRVACADRALADRLRKLIRELDRSPIDIVSPKEAARAA